MKRQTSDEYVKLLHGDEMPVSSQPSLGDMLQELEGIDEDVIMLTVADGLSGEYSTAMSLRERLPNRDRIFVINSRSLAGPLRYMAVKAAGLRDRGISTKEIVSQIRACARSTISYVIPADFNYLRKSGRITNMTSRIGSALHLLPVLTFHTGGMAGNLHTSDFDIVDEEEAYLDTARIFAIHAYLLLKDHAALAKKLKTEYTPVFSDKEEYSAYVEAFRSELVFG